MLFRHFWENIENDPKNKMNQFWAVSKNNDYWDAFAKYGPVGVIIRIGDKIQRLISVTKNGVNMVKDESIRDTLLDLHNYATMAIMLLDEK